MADPTEQDLEAAFARLRLDDLLLQTLYSVSALTYRRLSPEDRDLAQARLGIEALRALLPVLEGTIPPEAVRDFNQVTANLQLAYASAAIEQPPAAAGEPPAPEPEAPAPEPEPEKEEPDGAG